MRKILFRGKELLCNNWVYGDLVQNIVDGETEAMFIVEQSPIAKNYEVNPQTVGQFTGLTDVNGNMIFEGDIVNFRHDGDFDNKGFRYRNYAVEFINTYVTYGLRLRNKNIHFPFKKATALTHNAQVVGNIYDNLELLDADVEILGGDSDA